MKNDPPNKKLTHRHLCSKIHRLFDETPCLYASCRRMFSHVSPKRVVCLKLHRMCMMISHCYGSIQQLRNFEKGYKCAVRSDLRWDGAFLELDCSEHSQFLVRHDLRILDAFVEGLTYGIPVLIHERWSLTFVVSMKVLNTPYSSLRGVNSSAPSRTIASKWSVVNLGSSPLEAIPGSFPNRQPSPLPLNFRSSCIIFSRLLWKPTTRTFTRLFFETVEHHSATCRLTWDATTTARQGVTTHTANEMAAQDSQDSFHEHLGGRGFLGTLRRGAFEGNGHTDDLQHEAASFFLCSGCQATFFLV